VAESFDAAHHHPPTRGLGNSSCVQDAYNMAWKLTLVLSDRASDSLLESYNQARQPLGEEVAKKLLYSGS
jgi:2,4-dichlorophenol 6-monooxygenase